MRKNRTKLTAFALTLIMLTSCGQQFDVPELKEPVAARQPYATVTRCDVGKVELATAIVVPKPYCHFWKSMVSIDKITVEVGQYVKKGDVLAVADVEVANEQSQKIQKEINLLQSVNNKTNEKYQLQKKTYELTLKGAEKINDVETKKQMKQALKELAENEKYNNALYRIQMNAKSKELSEVQKIVNNGNLIAEHEGYVTYIRDITVNNSVTKEDNVVIISDYKDSFIEMLEPQKTGIRDYEHVYVTENGVRHDLKELTYSENEMMVANSKQIDIHKRYVYADGKKLPEIGKQLLVVQKRKSAENVVAVDRDYLYQDEEGSYVYVKNGDTSEKRYVEFGVTDENLCEIVSGLEEGEKIFAKSSVVMPENFTEAKAELKDVTESASMESILVDDKKIMVEKFYGQGIIERIASDGYKTSKGELICQVATNEGAAVLNELRTQINTFKEGQKDACEQMDEQLNQLKKQLKAIQDAKDKTLSMKEDSVRMYGSLNQESLDVPSFEEVESDTESDENTTQAETTEANNENITTEETTEEIEDVVPPEEESFSSPSDSEEEQKPERKPEGQPGEEENQKVNPNAEEILKGQIKILEIEKAISNLNYRFNLSNMEENYSKQTRFNDGSGVKKYFAEQDCIVRKTYCSKGDEVGYAQRLFAIGVPGTPKMAIKSKVFLPLNQKVEVLVDGEVKYTGKIVSNSGISANYITTRDDQVYITSNNKESSMNYYMLSDDKDLYTDPVQKVAKCMICDMEQVVVVPGNAVQSAKRQGKDEYYYVWKKVDGEWNKQVVIAYPQQSEGEIYYVVVSGLRDQDVVAVCN